MKVKQSPVIAAQILFILYVFKAALPANGICVRVRQEVQHDTFILFRLEPKLFINLRAKRGGSLFEGRCMRRGARGRLRTAVF